VSDVTRAGLGAHTTLRLGGSSRYVASVHSRTDIISGVRDARGAGEPLLILAGGSNVVIADEGFPGTTLLLRTTGIEVAPAGDGEVTVTVQAGQAWDDLVAMTVAEGLAGIECLSGIPGSAGATPIQNVGAYGQEVAQRLVSVTVYDTATDSVVSMSAQECGFSYRSSVFKHSDRRVVLDVTLKLRRGKESAPIRYAELARTLDVDPGAVAPLHEVRRAVLGLRAGKGMVLDPLDPDTYSVGSFFTNPVLDDARFADLRERAVGRTGAEPAHWPDAPGAVKVSAAWLIERAGFGKGYSGGRSAVSVSTKHSLALTNRGTGSTAELLDLAREIRSGVQDAFGVELVPEPVLINCSL
jgi:UDP-N-acetylmuramate dehydrogenase